MQRQKKTHNRECVGLNKLDLCGQKIVVFLSNTGKTKVFSLNIKLPNLFQYIGLFHSKAKEIY